MTPEFYRELLSLDERDAEITLRLAMSRVGSNEHGGPPKARVLHNLVTTMLGTGWPEQDGVAHTLTMIRNDIDRRLAQARAQEPC